MTREKLRDSLEIIGLIAIVASLIFLALEIRQANVIAMGQAYQSRTDGLWEMQLRIAESDTLIAIADKLNDGIFGSGTPQADEPTTERFFAQVQGYDEELIKQLTPQERLHWWNFLMAHQHRLGGLAYQYEIGLLDEEYLQTGLKPAARVLEPRWKQFGVPIQGRQLNALMDESD